MPKTAKTTADTATAKATDNADKATDNPPPPFYIYLSFFQEKTGIGNVGDGTGKSRRGRELGKPTRVALLGGDGIF